MTEMTCQSNRGDRLDWIATAYGLRDFALCVSLLRAHGVLVAGEPWHTVANLPHYSGALGGIPVRVPARHARRALALLCSAETAPATTDRPSLGYSILIAVVFILVTGFSAAPPSSGLVINCRSQTQGTPQNGPRR